MSQKIVAGIDIGGTYTKYGLVNESGKILKQDSVPTTDFATAEKFVNAISTIILREAEKIKGAELQGTGIGSPNGNYYSGTVEFAPNLRWKGIIPMAKLFMDATRLPAVLTNDAKAAAIGEMIFGAAKNMKHFYFITLGTGLGSGIVVDGKIVYGHDGFAGELGHTTVTENGRNCGCGRKGCLEQYCSATGITRTYLELISGSGRKLRIPPKRINAKFIYEKYVKKEPEALQAFEFTGHILGVALANACCYTSPEAIFLFGGLTQSGDAIFKPVKKSFRKNLLKIYKGKTKILPSSLPENEAGILGASSLMWNELKKLSE
ncbi:MAG TPA: ROK family protein [Chitinophagales bacterium]|nr:ROK family protein [Chitinophagales bacterium]